MNIIHVIPTIRTGGGTVLLQNILKNLSKNLSHQIWTNKVEEKIIFYKTKIVCTKHSEMRNLLKIVFFLIKE